MDTTRERFMLIPGGKLPEDEGLGPITRMGLRDRLPYPTRRQWAWVALTKLVLLGSLLYLFFGK